MSTHYAEAILMDTHNMYVLRGEAILMSTHNVNFYGEIWKILIKQAGHLICYTGSPYKNSRFGPYLRSFCSLKSSSSSSSCSPEIFTINLVKIWKMVYCKNPKNSDTRTICCNHPKI